MVVDATGGPGRAPGNKAAQNKSLKYGRGERI